MITGNGKKLPESLIDLSDLQRRLHYDPDTGLFTRKIQLNNRYAGTSAGSERIDGYIYITIGDIRILAHRLAWFYIYGEWPPELIDHINGIRSDNRLENLRLASYAQNNINRGPQINNALQIKGIKRHGNKFVARITKDRVQYYLGLFETIEDAVDARKKKEQELYGEFAGGQT